MKEIDHIELYDIHMSLSEGMIRNIFPNLTKIIHKFTNRKALMMAVDHYVKQVDSGIKASLKLAVDTAKIFNGVNWRELVELIKELVNEKQIHPKYLAD